MTDFENPVKTVTKRNGEREPADAMKLVKWSEWAARKLNGRVHWPTIVRNVLMQAYDGIPTAKLQNNLINECLRHGDWAHNVMAGGLWAPTLQKELYGDKIPTVLEHHRNLQRKGLMKVMPYTDSDYEVIQSFIDHTRDFDMAHFQIKQNFRKYAIRDMVTDKSYETPQFIFMRMAMEFASKDPIQERLTHVKNFYEEFSINAINAPTPNYLNAGTKLDGYVSCCLYTTNDDIPSLSVGDHIAYRMTAIGAGIGAFIRSRGLGEGVRGGAIQHNGKTPYFDSQAGAVKANMQSGRAGACTSYYNIFDVEASAIAQLQDPRAPEDKRNRKIHFAVSYHGLFMKKAALNENVFTFSCKTAPDLFDAFYGKDRALFESLYNRYEQDPTFKKNYVNARDLLVMTEQQGPNIGTHYDFFADNANAHTPFLEPIYSSNLCVAPETVVTTSEGDFEIQTLKDKVVKIWNGEQWSEVTVKQTGHNQHLVNVTLESGKAVYCTPYHKWYAIIDGAVKELRTMDLKPGMQLETWTDTNGVAQSDIVSIVIDTHRIDDTYCFTEPLRNRGMFNGVITGQCLEIMEVTHPYKDSDQLHKAEYHGIIKFLDSNGQEQTIAQNTLCWFIKDGQADLSTEFPAGELEEGAYVKTIFGEYFVEKILVRDQQPEVALCSLAGIVEPNIRDDAHYEHAMYYAQRMIDYCIHNSSYPFAHIAFTAKKRLNAGIGLLGAATTMARKKLHYDTQEGLNQIHRMAERHMYFAIRSSIRLGKERGNAPWIHKTLWPKGWLPIDTYKREVDEICNEPLHYDWEAERRALIENKGMRFSCLVAHMPTESSSKAAGVPNSWYPVRMISMAKSDAFNIIDWTATDSDLLGADYQLAFTIKPKDMIKVYAVIQKFTDQGISADIYMDRSRTLDISATDLVEHVLLMQRLGLKSRYYVNSKTDDAESAKAEACGSGGCTL